LRKQGHSLLAEDLDKVIEAQPDVLIFGTGYFGHMRIPKETRAYLESKGIELIEERTGKAVKRLNTRRNPAKLRRKSKTDYPSQVPLCRRLKVVLID
jgi:hypothetical protein